jgi:nucleoid DNA-binding protein
MRALYTRPMPPPKKKTSTASAARKSSPPTKAETQRAIAEKTGLPKTDVVKVLDALEEEMAHSLRAHGQFTFNGLLRIVVVHKPAKPAHKGINPFTKEEITIKAKPAHNSVRARPLKRLKNMV